MRNLLKKKRDNEDDQSHPRVKITKVDDSVMDIDYSNRRASLTPSPSPSSPCPSLSPSPSFLDQPYSYSSQQDCFEVSSELNKMSIDLESNNENISSKISLAIRSTAKGVFSAAQIFDEFVPYVGKFIKLGEEIKILYEKAKHNKELCSFLLNRCNCAMAVVRDLDIRKTENSEFFSKRENLKLFIEFIDCIKKIKKFIFKVSKLSRLIKYLLANTIEEDFNNLVSEFDGYMESLNFSFTIQSRDELSKMKNEIRQIKETLLYVYGISDNRQSFQEFLTRINLVTEKNNEFQTQNKRTITNSSEFIPGMEANEPLLDGRQFQKTNIFSKKRIEKRTSFTSCEEYCFKEFLNNSSSLDPQIEIRRQVNILKELKNSDHIIRFSGVAQEDSKYYLVTEWMEHGNLYEYYTNSRESIDWETKIKFALDICRGVSYLHECKILHHDIQSANILVNGNIKVRIANFGVSKKFSEITRNVAHNLENIRYMAPEKLLLDNDEEICEEIKKKVHYVAECEIYSVGALLWEIAELKKPHSDIKSEMLDRIRKRVKERYSLPFSKDVPPEWINIVSRAMEYEPKWRLNISDICRDFYKLHKKYSELREKPLPFNVIPEDYDDAPTDDNNRNVPYFTITILTVDDAIRMHKSKDGNKELVWQSFKHHSSTSLEAKYWLGHYYYDYRDEEEIAELQQIDRKERIRIAVEIFKETADKGNPSAQLRYGICLWQGEGIKPNSVEALKYLKSAAASGNSAAMYIIGKAYWSGSNGIEQDKNQGTEYLRNAALNNHSKAKELCVANNIIY